MSLFNDVRGIAYSIQIEFDTYIHIYIYTYFIRVDIM